MREFLEHAVGTFKTLAPWVTGGLAGAVFTFVITQWQRHRSTPRIDVSSLFATYSLPPASDGFGELLVSYNGTGYNRLSLFEFVSTNVCAKTVPASQWAFAIGTEASVVEEVLDRGPFQVFIERSSQPLGAGMLGYHIGDLKPGGRGRIALLLSESPSVQWYYRGSDDVVVADTAKRSYPADDRDILVLIVWVSLYVTVGFIPFFSEVVRGALIVAASPYLLRFARRLGAVRDAKTSVAVSGTQVGGINDQAANHKASMRGNEERHAPGPIMPVTRSDRGDS